MLLLGAGESGKSTFLKQMRIIHGVNFEPELVREYQQVIYQNLIKGMQVLVDARQKLGIEWRDPTLQKHADHILNIGDLSAIDSQSFRENASVLRQLWTDEAVRDAYDRRREFQIVCCCFIFFLIYYVTNCVFQSDSVSYFLDEIDRIDSVNYVPSSRDILYCRKATKGVHEFMIRISVSAKSHKSKIKKYIYFVCSPSHRPYLLCLLMSVDSDRRGENGSNVSKINPSTQFCFWSPPPSLIKC